jgi:hypothetical protein
MWPSEKTAFEVVGLQNSLMVAALSCKADESYNRFMVKFQPVLVVQQGVMDRYFVREGGLAGRQLEDGFMTRLANEHSAESLAKGAGYCTGMATAFREVLGLPDLSRLAAFATGDGGAELASMAVCEGTPPLGLDGGPRTVIAAGPARLPGGEMVAGSAGGALHAKRKPVVKAPVKPVTGLVQV